jgi:hypothetical protein
MAYAAFADRAIEAAFEQALCKRLNTASHACTTMLHEAPPTRERDAASRYRASQASGAQAMILIELADPDSVSRRVIAASRPACEISVVDTARQQVVARFLLKTHAGSERTVARQADVLTRGIVASLAQKTLFYERSKRGWLPGGSSGSPARRWLSRDSRS